MSHHERPKSSFVLPWVVAPPLLLVPILITSRHGFAATTGIINAVLLVLWCVALPLSLMRLAPWRRQRPGRTWLLYLQLVLNATLLVACEHAPSVYDQLAMLLVAAFAATGLMAGVRTLRAMKAMQAPARARLGLVVMLGIGAVTAGALGLVSRKAAVRLAHTAVVAGGQREVRIYDQVCVPTDETSTCNDHRAFLYVRLRALPVVLYKRILPDTTFKDGHVDEREGRFFIDFGSGGPRYTLDPRTSVWQAN